MPALRTVAHTLRLAMRSLGRQPGFCTVAILTLAIGIGANTAVFSAINGVLLQPLPYHDADRLAVVNVAPDDPGGAPGSMSLPDLADLRDDGASFSSLVGVFAGNYTLTGLGDPEIIEATRVSEGLLGTFGVPPAMGRDIRRDEARIGAPRVAVISHEFWTERFGASADVIGRTMQLNGESYEVVGVAPPGFAYPANATLWIPGVLDPEGCGRGCHVMEGIGRLAAGATFSSATSELDQLASSLAASYPQSNTDKRFLVRDLKTTMLGDVRAGLWTTLGAAVLVLLIAAANVASLLLARASAREGEMAVRAALGASRARLAAQVFAEGAVLAMAGGAAGVAIAYAGVASLRRVVGDALPRAELIRLDPLVLGLAVLSILVVMVVFSAVPAFAASRVAIAGTLSSVGRGGTTGASTVRFRRALLAGEVALSTCLLIGAGLLFRTLTQLQSVNVGFETRQIARFTVVLPDARYPDMTQASQFYTALEAEVAAMPGVEAVGAMFGPPLGRGQANGAVLVTGRPEPAPGDETIASVHSVTAGLLTTLRIPLKRGRVLTPADNRPDAEPVAVVNETFARENFPNQDPIGQLVTMTVDFGFDSPAWRIVGVVGDAHFTAITEPARGQIYMPLARYGPASTTVHIRTNGAAPALMSQVRSVIGRLDPDVAIFRVETLEQVMHRARAATTLYLRLVALFAVVAALLAGVGLYGVVSYMVVQRRREIAVRVALGAPREGIIALVLRQGMRPVAIGIVTGALVALAAGRYLESILFNVHPTDPLTFGGAVVFMTAIALLAAAVPAVRASGVDPAGVLHGD